MNSHQEMIDVISAHRDGKQIEMRALYDPDAPSCYHGRHKEWGKACNDPPRFNFGINEYRIKPSPPKPREYFARLNNEGLIPSKGIYFADNIKALDVGKAETDTFIHLREVLPPETDTQ